MRRKMIIIRNILFYLTGIVVTIGLLFYLGLQIRPQSFHSYPEKTPELETMPLPTGLPLPVERYYRTLYGDEIPMINTVVLQGRGVIKPFMNIPISMRFIFIHTAGKDYRHYFEATWFGIRFLHIDEGFINGASFFESPMGSQYDKPKANQGANLALWAEAIWFPSLWLTDPRVSWKPVDDNTALLYVPSEDSEENFLVRFDPQTGLIAMMEAMRYRDTEEGKSKILWICFSDESQPVEGTNIRSAGSVMWLDQGQPWAYFNVEEMIYNADVSEKILQRGN